MNIVLTGATGFLGTHLRQELARGHEVHAVARSVSAQKGEPLSWIEADLATPGELAKALPSCTDSVIHLAQSKEYRRFPDRVADIFDVNVASTLALLEYARTSGAKSFVFASTASIYRQIPERLTEDATVEPASFYARSKRMAEMLVESYASYFKCVILRIFTMYGPGQSGMLIPGLIDKVRSGSPIQVQGEEGLILSPIYVDDVGRTVVSCISKEAGPGLEIINVGGTQSLSIRRMGEMIGTALGLAPQFEFTPAAEPGGWAADTSKLGSAVDLRDFNSFEEGIKKTL